jgi:hypothetical protein
MFLHNLLNELVQIANKMGLKNFKTGGAMPSLFQTSSWHGAYLIIHSDNFTFYIAPYP